MRSEVNIRDELSVVIAVFGADVITSILQEVVHCSVGVVYNLNFISLEPDLNADQRNVHVERTI